MIQSKEPETANPAVIAKNDPVEDGPPSAEVAETEYN